MSEPDCHIEVLLRTGPVEPLGWSPMPPGGADVVFIGRTRPEHHGDAGPLVSLHYEAHESMARPELEAIAHEAAATWPCRAIRVQHALGEVAIGQGSVVVEVVSDHRAQAFEAARWIMDALKQRVPIWKQCRWTDGTSWTDGTPVST